MSSSNCWENVSSGNRVAPPTGPIHEEALSRRLVRGRRIHGGRIRALRVRVPTLADVRNRGRTDRRGRAAPARRRGSGRFLAQLREAVGRARGRPRRPRPCRTPPPRRPGSRPRRWQRQRPSASSSGRAPTEPDTGRCRHSAREPGAGRRPRPASAAGPPGRPGDDGGGKVPEGAVGSAEDDAPPNGGGPPGCLGDDGGSCRSVTIPSFVSRCGFFVLQACLSGYPIRAPAAMGGVWRAGTEGRAGAGGPKTKSPP